MEPKRYWLFGGGQYYGHGGLHDLVGTFSEIADAIERANKVVDCDHPDYNRWLHTACPHNQWWHVVDTQTATIVAQSACQAYGAPQ